MDLVVPVSRELIVQLVLDYYMVGTLFLTLFLTGWLKLEMVSRKTGERLEDCDTFILSFCLYWPLLVLMLVRNLRRGENDDNSRDG